MNIICLGKYCSVFTIIRFYTDRPFKASGTTKIKLDPTVWPWIHIWLHAGDRALCRNGCLWVGEYTEESTSKSRQFEAILTTALGIFNQKVRSLDGKNRGKKSCDTVPVALIKLSNDHCQSTLAQCVCSEANSTALSTTGTVNINFEV
jgi:hypothetical protein